MNPLILSKDFLGSAIIRLMDIIQIAHYLDQLLDIENIKDSPRAVNGLQVQNAMGIRKVGLAVDACQATIEMAIERDCQMMFVHHGIFWGGLQPVRGPHYDKLSAMVQADFDAEVMNLRTLGVWFAFRAQVRARPEYLELVGMREREQLQKTVALFEALNHEVHTPQDPVTLARLMSALLEGFWTEYYLYPRDFDRDKSIAAVFTFLDAFYSGRFGLTSG